MIGMPSLGASTHDVLWQRLIWVGLAAAILGVAGFIFILIMRKRLRSSDTPSDPFTLQDLREMLQRGDITRAEYEAMRGAIVGMSGGSAKKGGVSDKLPDFGDHFDPPHDIDPDKSPDR